MATLTDIRSPEALDEALSAPGLVVLDVYTQSCVICRRIEPMIAAVAATSGGVVRALKIDAEAHLDFAAKHDVRGVPTVLLFREGRLIDRRSGFFTAADLREWIRARIST